MIAIPPLKQATGLIPPGDTRHAMGRSAATAAAATLAASTSGPGGGTNTVRR